MYESNINLNAGGCLLDKALSFNIFAYVYTSFFDDIITKVMSV